jgi:hypothetical protein
VTSNQAKPQNAYIIHVEGTNDGMCVLADDGQDFGNGGDDERHGTVIQHLRKCIIPFFSFRSVTCASLCTYNVPGVPPDTKTIFGHM